MALEIPIDLGAVTADDKDGVVLDDFPQFPPEARLEYVHVDNDSAAVLTVESMPGKPLIKKGELGRQFVRCGREFHVIPDTTLAAGDVILTLGISWPGMEG